MAANAAMLKEGKVLDFKAYELQVVCAQAKVQRYQDELAKIEKKQSPIKTQAEMSQLDEQAKDILI